MQLFLYSVLMTLMLLFLQKYLVYKHNIELKLLTRMIFLRYCLPLLKNNVYNYL